MSGQEERLAKIDQTWDRLKKFAQLEVANTVDLLNGDNLKRCAICTGAITEQSLLEFTGTAYHKQCANLWINRVDTLLPKLERS